MNIRQRLEAIKNRKPRWTVKNNQVYRKHAELPPPPLKESKPSILETVVKEAAANVIPAILQMTGPDTIEKEKIVEIARELINTSLTSEEEENVSLESPVIPPPLPLAKVHEHLVKRDRLAENRKQFDNRRLQLLLNQEEKFRGRPLSKEKSQYYAVAKMIPLERIVDDEQFKNFRLTCDDSLLDDLQESIRLEGLKVPIIVTKDRDDDDNPGQCLYSVRAGFRRTQAFRNLNWPEIPAVVLPYDTTRKEEYWVNILENETREKLSTYELAKAAQLMRDKFDVGAEEFALRIGYKTSGKIIELLRCVDNLPDEVLNSWRQGDHVPLSEYIRWSLLRPQEAIRALHVFFGKHPTKAIHTQIKPQNEPAKKKLTKPMTEVGYKRSEKLLMCVNVSRISPDQRQLAIQIIEFLQGCRAVIPGIYDQETLKGIRQVKPDLYTPNQKIRQEDLDPNDKTPSP